MILKDLVIPASLAILMILVILMVLEIHTPV